MGYSRVGCMIFGRRGACCEAVQVSERFGQQVELELEICDFEEHEVGRMGRAQMECALDIECVFGRTPSTGTRRYMERTLYR